ncbi:MAG: hypothetical protein VR68_13630 [Peptococcaceae bacterium BRH_c4a]|nr:MAG: hypothetical protein VR68_13630 [Peptococcaceae bacterium BRH_c4a]
MRKLNVIIVCLVLAMAGCSSGNIKTGTIGIENEVFPVVERYLENSAAGNWREVFETLSGEALAETRANAGRVKVSEKIVSKILKLNPVCQDVAEVSADFTKAYGGGVDRLAYNFRLKKHEGRWLIYMTTYGEYQHGELKSGQLPLEAAGIIKTYLELPFNEKRTLDHKYLAGKILQDSLKSKLLPMDTQSVKQQENIKTRVKTMECLGMADGYAVVRVGYDVIKDSEEYPVESLVEVLDVNGAWKICRMDITKS